MRIPNNNQFINRILAIAIFVFLSFSVYSQEWTQQYPTVELNQLLDVYVSPDNHGWAVGQRLVMRTTDGGQHWQKHTTLPNPTFLYQAVEYVEGSNGQRLFLGTNHNLYETTDGGNTWIQVNFWGSNVLSIRYTTAHITVFTQNGIYHSGDDGSTWTSALTPSESIVSMTFGSDLFGAASVEGGAIYYTNDGGATWILSPITPSSYLTNLVFASTQVGYASVKKDIYKTTDGGQSWSLISDETVHPFYYFKAASETELYASRGNSIYHSTDSGVTWKRGININFVYSQSDIHIQPDGKVWVAGSYGAIFHSDGGEWVDQNSANKNRLVSIKFYNDLVGIATGGDRTLLKTVDGGVTWQDISDKKEDYQTFNDVYFISDTEFMLSGEDGLLKTTNGGNTWTTQAFPTTTETMAFSSPEGSNKIFLSGDSGSVFVSDDNGQNWTTISTPAIDQYQNIHFPTEQVGYVTPYFGSMMKTIDGGNTWNSIPLFTTKNLRSADFVSADKGFVLESGYTDFIWTTDDGAQSWTKISLPLNSYWNKIEFYNDQIGWIIGGIYNNGLAYQTTDGGATWELLHQSAYSLSNIFVSKNGNDESIWLCGNAGVILHKGLPVNIIEQSQKIADLTVFPNPLTSDALQINWPEGISDRVVFRILTLSGRIVREQRNHFTNDSVLLDKIPNGCYFLQVIDLDEQTNYQSKVLIMR